MVVHATPPVCEVSSDISQVGGAAWRSPAQRFKVGAITGAVGLGTEAVTGLGFRPSLILFTSTYNGVLSVSDLLFSTGSWDSAGNCTIATTSRDASGQATYGTGGGPVAGVLPATLASWYYRATPVSMDADGFTLDFGASYTPPAWMRINWTAFA